MAQIKGPDTAIAINVKPSAVSFTPPSVLSLPSLPFSEITESQLLSDLTHDLRHPASLAVQCAWMLQDQSSGPLSGTQAKVVDDIVRSSREALAQVDALLAWLQAEAGCLALAPTAINLDYFLPELVSTLRQKLGVEIGLALRLDDARIVCDRYRLSYILTTLIERALSVSELGPARIIVHDRPDSWVVDSYFPPTKPNAVMFSGTGLLLTNALVKKLAGHIRFNAEAFDADARSRCLSLTLPRDCQMA